RDQLLDVAMHLFSRYGLEGTTTKDIAKAAGVSPGLLYHYYESKEDLLVDVIKRFQNRPDMSKLITDNDYGPLKEAFLRILTALRAYFETHIDEIWLIIRAAARFPSISETLRSFKSENNYAFAEFFIRRMEAGEIKHLDSPERLAGLLCHIIVSELLMQAPQSANLEDVVEVLLNGLVPN
ncbi:TetR/AcrR family transcriptional regulator, partial [bacterium]|nr:TetR/AcrR family transcriptional regulator [bacterium]